MSSGNDTLARLAAVIEARRHGDPATPPSAAPTRKVWPASHDCFQPTERPGQMVLFGPDLDAANTRPTRANPWDEPTMVALERLSGRSTALRGHYQSTRLSAGCRSFTGLQ